MYAQHRLLGASDAEEVAVAIHEPGAGGCGTREHGPTGKTVEAAHGVRKRLADILVGRHRVEREREIRCIKTSPDRAVDEYVISEILGKLGVALGRRNDGVPNLRSFPPNSSHSESLAKLAAHGCTHGGAHEGTQAGSSAAAAAAPGRPLLGRCVSTRPTTWGRRVRAPAELSPGRSSLP
eukprot:scaffold30904_cov88-Phaeocystis_antarctica.AAC.6